MFCQLFKLGDISVKTESVLISLLYIVQIVYVTIRNWRHQHFDSEIHVLQHVGSNFRRVTSFFMKPIQVYQLKSASSAIIFGE